MNKHRPRILFLILVGALASLFPLRTGVADQKLDNHVHSVVKQTRDAFVFIGGGSGAVISADGYLITNAHVIGKKKQFTVRLGNGQSHKANLVGLNRQSDLALLKIPDAEDLPHLTLGNSGETPVGEYCLAIGNPLALGMVDQNPSISLGVLSTKHLYRGTYNDALVTDAPVNPGNSGGPLLNLKGEIIGVIGQIETRWGLRANTGIGLAISADQIKRWLPKLKNADGDNVPRGYLRGIQWKAMRAEKNPGAPIKDVAKGSPAEAEGLQGGDVIVGINGLDVWNVSRIRGILQGYPAGTKGKLRVQRGDSRISMTVRLRKPPKIGFKLDLAEIDGNKRIVIKEVKEESAAARAGLQKNDIVVAIGAQKLSGSPSHQKITAAVALRRMFATGRTVVLTIKRQKNDKTVKQTIRFFPGGNK